MTKPAVLSITAIALAAALLGPSPRKAHAESLRCSGGIAAEGDSRLSVVYKCGQPQLVDAFCAPVVHGGTPWVVPPAYAGLVVPCQATEQWLYERGEGNLVATVRFRGGTVQSISYGRTPP